MSRPAIVSIISSSGRIIRMSASGCKYQNEDCTHAYARDMCRFHYHRVFMGKDPLAPKIKRKVNKGTTCSFQDCDRESVSGLLCHTHDMQMRTRGYLTPIGTSPRGNPPGTEPCKADACETRASDLGYCSTHYQSYRNGKLGKVRNLCAVYKCPGESTYTNLCSRHNYKMRTYGLDFKSLTELLQSGKCHSCGREVSPTSVHIDHDHLCCPSNTSCGACVRGALCRECNQGIGFLGDTSESVQGAVEYLKRFELRS